MIKSGWLEKNIKKDKWTEILVDSETVDRDEKGNYLINIAYRRVSTDKQAAEGYGLEVQRDEIIRYCSLNKIENCVLFTDDGVTGTKMERDGLEHFVRLVKNFNSGLSDIKVNSLIVPRMDRLSRSLLGTLQFIQDYIVNKNDSRNSDVNTNTYDIDFISIAEPFCRVDKNNPTSKLMLTLFASLAEYDRDQIVAKLKRGRIERAKTGRPMGGGKTPYGYRYDKEKGIYTVVPEEREKVREIFRLYVEEKMSPAKIAEMLGFKGERTVSQILKRRSSLGLITYQGEEYKGLHEPLISEDMFYAAEEEMKKRSTSRGPQNYMLSGLVYCGKCGGRMRYQKWGKDLKIVCYSQQKSRPYLIKDPECDNLKYSASEIENAVANEILALSYKNNAANKKTVPGVEIVKQLETTVKRKEEELRRLYNVYAESGSRQLLEVINGREKEIEKLRRTALNEKEKQFMEKKAVKTASLINGIGSAWEHMTAGEKKTVCRELIDKVVLTGGVKPTVEVHFKLQEYLDKR